MRQRSRLVIVKKQRKDRFFRPASIFSPAFLFEFKVVIQTSGPGLNRSFTRFINLADNEKGRHVFMLI